MDTDDVPDTLRKCLDICPWCEEPVSTGPPRPGLIKHRFFHRACAHEYIATTDSIDLDLGIVPEDPSIDVAARIRFLADEGFDTVQDLRRLTQPGRRAESFLAVASGFADVLELTRALTREAAIGILGMERIPLHYQTIARILDGDPVGGLSSGRRVLQLLRHDPRVRYMGDGVFALAETGQG